MKAATVARREAEQRLRRDHILLAAERVFGRTAFDQASMQAIAKEAGMGMHGLYRHFTSKEQLYEEIVLLRLEEIAERVEIALADADAAGQLRVLAVAHATFFLERPHFFPLHQSRRLARDWGLKTRFGKAIDRCLADVDARLEQAIEAGVKAGLLRPLGTRLLAEVARGIFNSVIQHHLLHAKTRDPEACATEIEEIFFRGIGTGQV